MSLVSRPVIFFPLAFVVRIALIGYGEWQDAHMLVKYTDVDYHVFTDAARFTLDGQSPYTRATYRYTPLLAFILFPNIWLHISFGKILFSLLDILVGYFIYRLLRTKCNARDSMIFTATWLFNPLSINVSTRGNAESILSFLVLISLYLLHHGQIFWAAVMYGLSVHFKIYPITYALALYLHLGPKCPMNKWTQLPRAVWQCLFPNRNQLVFTLVSASTCLTLTGVMYLQYGWVFLFETYLYHFVRTDPRHNFSVYFYQLYLTSADPSGFLVGLLSFLPQLAALALVSFYFTPLDLHTTLTLITVLFVTFNKVCTVQYFIWYLCLLPLVLPHLRRLGWRAGLALFALWQGAQVLWLRQAYRLEFLGEDTFLSVWAAGVLFFAVNVGLVVVCMRVFAPVRSEAHKRE